ncbi:MAG: Ribosomal protein L11 methyltransferase [candidate division Zixibacteria bacterium RBG-1]|nr:MAG: Ribosomal protein L11 methyltransferase [candidate division Zixibacteria bacterium RBG-1]OGC85775.1 MAG: ribosomal protein L11 methyltransferase [candidate division Zixibacteria bacterium RBG_19FT_COMBO_42_43]
MKKPSPKKKNYFAVRISTPAELSDPLSNFLTELGFSGVIFKEEKEQTILTSFIPENSSHLLKFKLLRNYLAHLRQIFPQLSSPQIKISKVKALDWSKNWRKNFKPLSITKNILVKPPWVKKKFPHKIVINIYPQMAFGTGEHATTQMCLKLLEKFVQLNFKVLDLGTGSGILAIASSKLGAQKVVALDIDSDAIDNAQKNLKLNKVSNINFRLGGLNSQVKPNYFDLAVANLNFTQIKTVLNQLKEKVKPKGTLILSGLLNSEEEKIKNLLKSNKLDILRVLKKNGSTSSPSRAKSREGWISVAARKKAHN